MNRPASSRHAYKGLTIIELMVAMVLSLIVLSAISSVYVTSKQSFRSNDNLSRIQENARIAFETLAREIRQSAFYGCAGQEGNFHTTLNSSSNILFDYANPISGFEATNSTSWHQAPSTEIESPLGGRDILVVRTIDEGGGPVVTHANSTSEIEVPTGSKISNNDILMASNCATTTVFLATSVTTANGKDTIDHSESTSTPGNSTKDLKSIFINGELRRLSTKIFYIRNNPKNLPSLYVRRSDENAAQELVEGIEGMQITYGEDINGDFGADEYRTANNISNWNNVSSVRIELTIASPEDSVATTTQIKSISNETDRRIRKSISTTIALRNRTG